ncbi:MAG: DUF1540 domain-containing protein [Lachnospirales bacterium]
MSINCSVSNCHYNEKSYCVKKDIVVGRTTSMEAKNCKDTECESFEA